MVDALHAWLHEHSRQQSLAITFLTPKYDVYDWVRLSFFTGSRMSKYSQSASHQSSIHGRYTCVLINRDMGPLSDQTLTFIAEDFTLTIHPDRPQVLPPQNSYGPCLGIPYPLSL
jgi:hypothetical protein